MQTFKQSYRSLHIKPPVDWWNEWLKGCTYYTRLIPLLAFATWDVMWKFKVEEGGVNSRVSTSHPISCAALRSLLIPQLWPLAFSVWSKCSLSLMDEFSLARRLVDRGPGSRKEHDTGSLCILCSFACRQRHTCCGYLCRIKVYQQLDNIWTFEHSSISFCLLCLLWEYTAKVRGSCIIFEKLRVHTFFLTHCSLYFEQ